MPLGQTLSLPELEDASVVEITRSHDQTRVRPAFEPAQDLRELPLGQLARSAGAGRVVDQALLAEDPHGA
jgi:hypothetical protein